MINNNDKLSLTRQEGGSHYQLNGPQPIELILTVNPTYAMCNVLKYLARYKKKAGLLDLKKAMHYLDFAIEFDPTFTSKFEMASLESWLASQTVPLDDDIVQCLRASFSKDYNIAKTLLTVIIDRYKAEFVSKLRKLIFDDRYELKPIVPDAPRYYVQQVSQATETDCRLTNAETGHVETVTYETLFNSYIIV